MCKIIRLDNFLTPYTKINAKWIKDVNIRPETVKLLEENIQALTSVLAICFLDLSPQVINTKAKINK